MDRSEDLCRLFADESDRGRHDSTFASGYGAADTPFEEFDRRRRMNPGEAIVGPADVFRADGASLGALLGQYRSPAPKGSEDDCILVDGRRAFYQPLDSFRPAGVQLIEVLRPADLDDGFVSSEMEPIPECRGSSMHHPTYFVLWTRSLR